MNNRTSSRLAVVFMSIGLLAASATSAATVTADFTTIRNQVRIHWGTNEKDFWRYVAGVDGNDNTGIIMNYQAVGNEVVRMWVEYGWNAYPNYLDPFVEAVVEGGSTPMFCMVKKPDYYSNGQFAQWCINILNRYDGMYDTTGWYVQLINEPNLFGPSLSEYVDMYNYVAPLIKAQFPQMYIGGPGVAWFPTDWITTFLQQCYPADFLEWHRYGDWIDPSSATDEYFMDRTPMFGQDVDTACSYAVAYGRGDIKLHMGEYNVNSYWTPVDPRCTSIFNAAFTGSVLRHLIDTPGGNTADMEMYWEGTGDAWGLWHQSPPNTRYPAFYTKQLYSWFCHRGDEIATCTSTSPSYVEGLALKASEASYRVFLISKRSWTQYVYLNIVGPAIESGTWYVIDSTSYASGGIDSWPAGPGNTYGLTLRGYGVTVLDAVADMTMTSTSPPGWLRDGWNLVSVPLDPEDGEASAVWDENIAAGNTLTNNMYSYSPSTGYRIYPSGFTTVSPGEGYWLYLASAVDESVTGERIWQDFTIPLQQGWNLIGCPHESAVWWPGCTVSDGAETKTIAEADAAGWIQGTAYFYDGEYRTVATDGSGDDYALRPWRGYWLLANQAGLELTVPAP